MHSLVARTQIASRGSYILRLSVCTHYGSVCISITPRTLECKRKPVLASAAIYKKEWVATQDRFDHVNPTVIVYVSEGCPSSRDRVEVPGSPVSNLPS